MGPLIFLTIAVVYLAYSVRNRSNALLGAAVLLPYHQWLPGSGFPMVNLQTLIPLMLLWACFRKPTSLDDRVIPRAPRALMVVAVTFVVGYLASVLRVAPPQFDAFDTFQLMKDRLTTVVVCYGAFALAGDTRIVHRAFWATLLGYGAESFYAFLEFLFQPGQVTGHMGARTPMGAFLCASAGVSIGVFLGWRSDRRRWLFFLLAMVSSVAAAGSNSRGATAGVILTLLVATLWKSRVLFIGLLVLALNYELWMPKRTLERFQEGLQVSASGEINLAEDGTGAERVEIWKAGLRTFVKHPLGIGLGLYPWVVDPTSEGKRKDAHNEFILVLVELGLIGVFIYLWLLGGLWIRAWRTHQLDEDALTRAMACGAMIGLVGALMASMFVSLVMRSEVSGFVWLLLGLSARREAGSRLALDVRTSNRAKPGTSGKPSPVEL